MKKLMMLIVAGILTIGSLIVPVAACGVLLGEDEIPESLR